MSQWILYIIITVGDVKHVDRIPQPDKAACLEAKKEFKPVIYNPWNLKPEPKYTVYCAKGKL